MQNKIYVGNLSFQTTQDELAELFGEFGAIAECKLITDFETGRSKGFSFITFETDESANAALALDGNDVGGRNIKVSIAKEDRRRQGGGGGGRNFNRASHGG